MSEQLNNNQCIPSDIFVCIWSLFEMFGFQFLNSNKYQKPFSAGYKHYFENRYQKACHNCYKIRFQNLMKSAVNGKVFSLVPFLCFSIDSPRSWSPKFYQDDVLVFIFGFSMLSYGSIPVIVSTVYRGRRKTGSASSINPISDPTVIDARRFLSKQ